MVNVFDNDYAQRIRAKCFDQRRKGDVAWNQINTSCTYEMSALAVLKVV